MSGTQPMTDLALRLVVTLTAGLSKTPRVWFAWGDKSDAISVGLRGNWAVLADELLDVHFYLSFDGTQVLVAPGGPGAVVSINENVIHGQRWWPVRPSDVIRAGQAQLTVTREAPALSMRPSVSSAPLSSTISDGGQLRAHARALESPKPPSPEPFAPRDVMKRPLADTVFAASPVPEVQRLASESPRLDAMDTMLSVAPIVDTAVPQKASAWSETSRPKKAILFSLPLLALAMLQDPDPLQLPLAEWAAAAKRAVGQAVVSEKQPAAAAPSASSAAAIATSERTEPAPPSAPTTSASASTPGSPEPSGSSAEAPSPAPTAAKTPPAPTAAKTPPAPTAAKTPPAPTAAKAALDAAFLGNFQESSRRYAQLAAESPDDPAYDLAARLTAQDAVRRP